MTLGLLGIGKLFELPTCGAVCILQTEAGLVPLRHLGAIECEEVVVGEDLDAVVMPMEGTAISQQPRTGTSGKALAPSLHREGRHNGRAMPFSLPNPRLA